MRHHKRWMATGLIVAGLQLTACGGAPGVTATKAEPAKVTAIDGTELSRVELVPDAAKRLDIQTDAVRDTLVERKRIVGGQVVDAAGTGGAGLGVRVPLSAGELSKVDRSKPVMILPLAHTAEAIAVPGKAISAPAGGDASVELFYAPEGNGHKLAAGQRVRVELTLAGGGTQRRVVPYASVIYDLSGDTWVYTSPEPLTFVRARIAVDYIEGDTAVLSQGPSAGTRVVTVGAAELYGTEFGVGH
jgi:multidrug efflux system membrane fusion protein